jgi:hypothetical protein
MFLIVSIWMIRQQIRRTHGTASYLDSLVKLYLISGLLQEFEKQKSSDAGVFMLISYTDFRPSF